MAIVPRPRKAGVSSSGPINPQVDASKLAAPGLAAINMAQTAAQGAADYLGHKEDLQFAADKRAKAERDAEEKRIKLKAEAKAEQADENLYRSTLNISKYTLNKSLASASSVFNQEAESAELEDILGIQDRLEKEYRKNHAKATEGLRPVDKEYLDRLLEVDMQAFRSQAKIKLADRTFTVEVASASDVLENNILDDSPSAQAAVKESVDIIQKHFPKEEADRRIAAVASKAHYKKLIVELDNAGSLEALEVLQDQVNELKGMFDPGTETALYNRSKGRQGELIAREARTQKDFLKLTQEGKMPDPEQQEEALQNGDVTEEDLKTFNQLARNQKNLADDKAAGEEYMKKRWTADYKKIKDLVKDLDGNPRVTQERLAEMEEIVNASTTSSYGRAQAKTQIAGLVSSAMADSDDPWWNPWGASGDMGDRFQKLDDTYNPQAREAMRRGVDMLSGMMQRSGVDIPLYQNITAMEKAVFDIYSAAQEAGQQVDPNSVDTLMRANAEKLTGLIIENALETQDAPADLPPAPEGMDAGTWANMTPEERALFE